MALTKFHAWWGPNNDCAAIIDIIWPKLQRLLAGVDEMGGRLFRCDTARDIIAVW